MPITASRFFSSQPDMLTPQEEDRFFTDLKTANNTFKRTASDRLGAFDDDCIRRFKACRTQLRQVLDIGISSGCTTLDLARRLRAAGQSPEITGTDLSFEGYLITIWPGMQVLVDGTGHVLQYDLFGLAVRAWTRRADYVTGLVAVRYFLHRISRSRIQASLRAGQPASRSVRLLSPRLADEQGIKLLENDIFTPTDDFVGRFDFIRAANILNIGYFDEAALRAALENVVSYLSGPDAWLLVARTKGGKSAATLFRVSRDGRRLSVLKRYGGGSEIERLVLATKPGRAGP